ncbi:ABC transporter substrate-binding protein [Castellaniella sp.]|uniref:ABC transporter substrate-binding protein n=1 Tax=Castellaniella sp. TaxID=1955812 RepID=UPI002AFE0690|nr:ABC transporter substrate-binding protein [Castellaniella sp.]
MKINTFKLSLITLAVATCMGGTSARAADKEPIKIGAVTSQSGVFAQQGEEVLRGIQFAVDEANANGGIDGRQVLIKTGDDESTPKEGLQASEKLARDGYKFLIGPIASSITMAIGQNLNRWDAMLVATVSKSDKITGDNCKPRMFRTNHSDAMDVAMFEEWMKDIPQKKFAIIAADYAWGHDSAKTFTDEAKVQGKEVALTLFPPLGTKDFAPYISQVKADPTIDGLWVALVGSDLIAYAKQAQSFGLTSKTTLGHAMIMNFAVNATGDAMKDIEGNMEYAAEIDTPRNAAFVKAWEAKFRRVPTDNEGSAYNGMTAIFAGVQKAGSVEPGKVSKALGDLTYETIYGPATMRAADHQLVIPNYVGEVKEDGGKLRPVLVRSFPASLVPAPSGECKMR